MTTVAWDDLVQDFGLEVREPLHAQGWQVWSVFGARVAMAWQDSGDTLRLRVSEPDAQAADGRIVSTEFRLSADGLSRGTHAGSPSTLLLHQGTREKEVVSGDGHHDSCHAQEGDVLVQVTLGLLEVVPAAALTTFVDQLATGTTPAAAAAALIRAAGHYDTHPSAGVVVIRRSSYT